MTSNLNIRPAGFGDALELAVTMREDDLREIEATSGRRAYEVLLEGLQISTECWTALYSGRVVAMWGVVDRSNGVLVGRCGDAWMLTSRTVDRIPKMFWRACKLELAVLLHRWDVLRNAIDCRYHRAIRWGKRLGFEFGEPVPMGKLGLPFLPFSVTKESLNV
jgi:hypothetical protein